MINRTSIPTPLGNMVACAKEEGICLLEFEEQNDLPSQLKCIKMLLDDTIVEGNHRHLQLLQQQLQEYFDGKRTEFTLPLIMAGTPFQQNVWTELTHIPYGSTRTYEQQSIDMQQPKAIRAIANANGKNKIAILIPCHRVVGKNGNLTGYAGGIWRKKWLLEMEMHSQIKINF